MAYEITMGVLGILGSAALLLVALWVLLTGTIAPGTFLRAPVGATFGTSAVTIDIAVGLAPAGVFLGRSARRRLLRL